MIKNNVQRVNYNDPGFATAATNPDLVDTSRDLKPNLGMSGPNKTRYNPLGFIARLISSQALPDNRWRNYLMIQNNSSDIVYISFGVHVSDQLNNAFALQSGAFYELDARAPFSSVFVKGVLLSGQQILLIEGIIDRVAR